jgi:hypothetical protein
MNFNTFPISAKNCFTFNKDTFDLSFFYEELDTFYDSVGLDNTIYYAHAFNKNGLFYNPYPISGFQVTENEYNSSFFSLFSDKDITFATDIENNEFDNHFNSLYKYNILSLYASLLKTLMGYNNGYNPLFTDKNKIEEDEFYLFINKIPLNIPEFDLFKDKFIKEYELMQ